MIRDKHSNEFEWQLAKRGKWLCPSCNGGEAHPGEKTLVCYVNASGQILDPTVGKCDRADKCGYHYPPREYYRDNELGESPRPKKRELAATVKASTIDPTIFFASQPNGHERDNHLIQWLVGLFGEEKALTVCRHYFVGSSHHWPGATVFWQLSRQWTCKAGKVMQYDASNGKRVKAPRPRVNWVHKVLNLDGFVLEQSLFGEHLLAADFYPRTSPVVVVESEKTALLAMANGNNNAIFMACGGCTNLNARMLTPIVTAGREVVLLPDNGQYDFWRNRAEGWSKTLGQKIWVSDYMEHHAVEEGDDIGDVIAADPNKSIEIAL